MKVLFGRKVEKKNEELILTGFDDKLNRRKEIASLIDKLTAEKEQIEQELKTFMGEAEVARNGSYFITWKPVVTNRIDTKLLKEEQPEIYKRYQRENCSRRLMIKMA